MRRRIVQSLVLLGLAAGFVAGLLVLAEWARDDLRHRERFTIPFAEIQCTPPPGMSRIDFLDEVRYLASSSAQLPLLDDALTESLREAFAKHPWVQKVSEVKVTAPRRLEVILVYRAAVLAVRCKGELRAVDANGILLPKQAATGGLPEFRGEASPPRGPAGTLWGDPRVEAAAAALRKSG